jgi:4-hydroxy-tetrahydrodipicolinate reductase
MKISLPTKVVITGAAGKMGRTLISMVLNDKTFKLVGAVEEPRHAIIGEDSGLLVGARHSGVAISGSLEAVIKEAHVVIDFTTPRATLHHLHIAARHKKTLVIGTTGFTAKQKTEIKKIAKKIPLVMAPNMSVGVNVLFQMAFLLGTTLGDEYDVEITEAHHRHKKDAPSGTALELASRVAEGRRIDVTRSSIYGRKGIIGAREKGTIGIHAIRGGDIIGEHTVSFMADGERVELTHKASSREAFARGALLAAHYLRKKKTGLYNMRQVLAL